MKIFNLYRRLVGVAICASFVGLSGAALADEISEPLPGSAPSVNPPTLFERATNVLDATLDATLGQALGLLGVPYRRGGASPESGFDCSGFVRHVFREGIGLDLPHNAKAMSKEGVTVDKQSLQPGDLVFFDTMRRAFSHVGIYLGDGLFVHSPRGGGQVRIENMQASYWKKRYNGARRVSE